MIYTSMWTYDSGTTEQKKKTVNQRCTKYKYKCQTLGNKITPKWALKETKG